MFNTFALTQVKEMFAVFLQDLQTDFAEMKIKRLAAAFCAEAALITILPVSRSGRVLLGTFLKLIQTDARLEVYSSLG